MRTRVCYRLSLDKETKLKRLFLVHIKAFISLTDNARKSKRLHFCVTIIVFRNLLNSN